MLFSENRWLNPTQCQYCVYKFRDKKFMDMYDIWGSRSGSKHTQELGKVLDFFFMIKCNGKERMKKVNDALNASNITGTIK